LAEEQSIDIRLIALEGKKFVLIDQLTPLHVNITKEIPSKSFKSQLKLLYYEIRKKIASLFSSYAIKDFILAPKYKYGLNYLMYRYSTGLFKHSSEKIEMQKGDMVLLLDSSWHFNVWNEVRRFKSSGAHIVTMVYDLIPMMHPQFCSDSLVYFFNHWFPNAFTVSDSFIAISKTVEKEVKLAVKKYNPEDVDKKKFTHFTLGSELDEKNLSTTVVKNLTSVLSTTTHTYLLVSTIEPRKNHSYLLDVFEKLWEDGSDVQLLFVGRLGWKNEQILKRIYSHPYYNKQLFMFNELNDNELLYCYQHAYMLLFPSISEGYGLPIVESLHYGLPVLASDIEIHREVGGDKIAYFDIAQPDDLISKIVSIEKEGFKQKIQKIDTKTWKESAVELLHVIQNLQKRSDEEK
jgi:alpha-1,2-rhamnosyltransferase